MAAADVETVRSYFDAANEGAFARAMSYYADDVVLVVSGHIFLESGTFKGKDAVGRWFGDWFRAFQRGYKFDLEEVRDLGDTVLVVAHHHGRGKLSGADVRTSLAYLFGVRDGRIARLELFPDRAAALEAAAGV